MRKIMDAVVVWLKRATGIGYSHFPPVMGIIDRDAPNRLEQKTNQIQREVDLLERELRRRGLTN